MNRDDYNDYEFVRNDRIKEEYPTTIFMLSLVSFSHLFHITINVAMYFESKITKQRAATITKWNEYIKKRKKISHSINHFIYYLHATFAHRTI